MLECIYLEDAENFTLTSSGTGTLDGRGRSWWGAINYLRFGENRPRLLHIRDSAGLKIEHIRFKDSPYWTFLADDIAGLEIGQWPSGCVGLGFSKQVVMVRSPRPPPTTANLRQPTRPLQHRCPLGRKRPLFARRAFAHCVQH